MELVKQLAIFMENKPGMLYRLCHSLAEKDINIEAISTTETVDHSIVRLVVNKPGEVIHLLGETGLMVVDSDLLKISLSNAPGMLARFCQQLVDMGSTIEYAYGSSIIDSPDVNLYIRVMDPEKVLQLFKG